MSDGTSARTIRRAVRLARLAVLLAALAGILFVAYAMLLPMPAHWSSRQGPIAVATAVGLVALALSPSGRADERARGAHDIAAMLGIASAVLGIGAAMLIAIGVTLNAAEHRSTIQSFLYQVTHPGVTTACLAMAAPAAIAGGLALAIARRRGAAAERVSAAGVAARFAAIGLGCAGLIVMAAASAGAYRWLTWG